MRTQLVSPDAGALKYEIRAIVAVAEEMKRHGLPVVFENIGDPIAKGERIPDWVKDVLARLVREDATWGYSPTKGVPETRAFIAERVNARGGVQIDAEDLLFFNGLGDAIGKIYGQLQPTARVVQSAPCYPAHALGEAGRVGGLPLTYRLDPARGWQPDLEDLRRQVESHPEIAAILLINPDNPTGAVWTEAALREVVEIARKNDLFVIADEIYGQLVYGGAETVPIGDLIGDVPALALKGVSKEVPWPGARSGWMEVYNRRADPAFADYVRRIEEAKMAEVCSTTLPQKAIPAILTHPEWPAWLEERKRRYEARAALAEEILSPVEGLVVNRTRGAFYLAVATEPGALTDRQTLPIENAAVRARVEDLVAGPNVPSDKRLVYYVLGATGLVTVPLSSFFSDARGFRSTLLEIDDDTFVATYRTLADALRRYLAS